MSQYHIEERQVHVTLYGVYGPNGILLAAFPTEDAAHDYAMAHACEAEA